MLYFYGSSFSGNFRLCEHTNKDQFHQIVLSPFTIILADEGAGFNLFLKKNKQIISYTTEKFSFFNFTYYFTQLSSHFRRFDWVHFIGFHPYASILWYSNRCPHKKISYLLFKLLQGFWLNSTWTCWCNNFSSLCKFKYSLLFWNLKSDLLFFF